MYVSELSKPDAKGKITVVNTKPLDDTKVSRPARP
jgi:hypothetical protein